MVSVFRKENLRKMSQPKVLKVVHGGSISHCVNCERKLTKCHCSKSPGRARKVDLRGTSKRMQMLRARGLRSRDGD